MSVENACSRLIVTPPSVVFFSELFIVDLPGIFLVAIFVNKFCAEKSSGFFC